MIFDDLSMDQAVAIHREAFGAACRERIEDKLIEEMAELTQAILKRRDVLGPRTADSDVEDEMSDVLICIEFFGRILGVSRDDLNARMSELEQKVIRQSRFVIENQII